MNRFGVRPYDPTKPIQQSAQSTAPRTFGLDDEMGYFLIHDPELAGAYEAALKAANIHWTDEEVAEAAFLQLYGDDSRIDDLMMAWHWQRALTNPNHPDHGRAWDIHEACQRWKAEQLAVGAGR